MKWLPVLGIPDDSPTILLFDDRKMVYSTHDPEQLRSFAKQFKSQHTDREQVLDKWIGAPEEFLYEHVRMLFRDNLLPIQWDRNRSKEQLRKIVVSDSAGKSATVTDPAVLNSFAELMQVERKLPRSGTFASGYQSDVELYTYQLEYETETFEINVVGRGVIQWKDDFYRVSAYIHHVGAALLPNRITYEESIGTKLMGAYMMKYNDFGLVRFQPFRIKSIAGYFLEKGKPINVPPAIQEAPVHTFRFYYYGEELSILVYEHNVLLLNGERRTWYQLERAAMILRAIFSAG